MRKGSEKSERVSVSVILMKDLQIFGAAAFHGDETASVSPPEIHRLLPFLSRDFPLFLWGPGS